MSQIWLIFDENDKNTQILRCLCYPGVPHIKLLTHEGQDEDLINEISELACKLEKFAVTVSSILSEKMNLRFQDCSLIKGLREVLLKEIKNSTWLEEPGLALKNNPDDEAALKFNSDQFVLNAVGLKVMTLIENSWVSTGTVYFGLDAILRDSLFIDGKWKNSVKGKQMLVTNPAKKEFVFHCVASATEEDVDDAVTAADRAFPVWSNVPCKTRARYLEAIADEIEKKKEMIINLEVMDMGKMKKEVAVDIADSISTFRYYAKILSEGAMDDMKLDSINSTEVSINVKKVPVGVVSLIIPWNYPFMNAAWKVAPCLASGSTCVLKPSEFTPLTVLELGAICKRVGLPAGVLNIINGTGQDTGVPMSVHPLVQKVSFTGSDKTGAKVMQNASQSIKTVTLELGGKSPIIVFPQNCDIAAVADWITTGIFFNNGQVCSATSRLIIHEDIKDAVMTAVIKIASNIKQGNGFSDANLGPLVNKIQYDRVIDYINISIKEGAKLLSGGLPDTTKEPYKTGYYIPPTIFEVNTNHTIWKDEVFGPVLAVHTFKTEEEAIKLANDTIFGLAAAVMTKDTDQAERCTNALRAGVVWINCSQPVVIEAPWGGMKASGIGREMGVWGLNNYVEIKQICSWSSKEVSGWNWFSC